MARCRGCAPIFARTSGLLLTRQDRHFYWVLACFAALLAVMAHGFKWL
jgi:hypothetical protein